jgi:hypothetical protein
MEERIIDEGTLQFAAGVIAAMIGYFSFYEDSMGNIVEAGLAAFLLTMTISVIMAVAKRSWEIVLRTFFGGLLSVVSMVALDFIF